MGPNHFYSLGIWMWCIKWGSEFCATIQLQFHPIKIMNINCNNFQVHRVISNDSIFCFDLFYLWFLFFFFLMAICGNFGHNIKMKNEMSILTMKSVLIKSCFNLSAIGAIRELFKIDRKYWINNDLHSWASVRLI